MPVKLDDKLRKVQELTGIDIPGFLQEAATMDPHGKDGRCIFCKSKEHKPDCMWVALRAVMGIS